MTERSRTSEIRDLFLWAIAIEIPHPETGVILKLRCEEPERFAARRRIEREAWAAVQAGATQAGADLDTHGTVDVRTAAP